MKDILIGTDANGQTVCIFRKNGMAIYGRWVGGEYQTEIVRRGEALQRRTADPDCERFGPGQSLEAELDAELRAATRRPRQPVPQPRARLAGENCPLCSTPMVLDDGSHPHRRSRDHIQPQRDGHKARTHGDTRNIRIVCQECNGLLNRLGQCPGAVACWIAVTRREWRAV